MPHGLPTPLPRLAALMLLVVGMASAPALRSQDIHFSMLDLDPLLFNPAYAGFFDGTARFGAVYRNQWASVSTPFQTLSATAEVGLLRRPDGHGGLGLGLWLNTDRAGSIGYGSSSASAIVSYYHTLDRYANHLLSVAIEAGAGQASFNPDDMRLPDADEAFDRTRSFYPTFGAGVAWFWQLSDEVYTKVGFGLRNINEPDISYTGLDSSPLARRFNIYGRAEWRFLPDWSLLPVVGYQHQGRYSEMVYGCDVRWYVDEQPRHRLAFGGGVVGRHGDAASIDLCVEYNTWTFALAYDANFSTLARASHTLGAFEVGIVYKLTKDRPASSRASLPCPIF